MIGSVALSWYHLESSSGGVALPPGDGGPAVVAGGLQGGGGLSQSEWLWAAKFGEPRLLDDAWELHTRGQW